MRDPSDGDAIDAWGIAAGYHDVDGRWISARWETVEALRQSMGDPVAGPPLWFVAAGSSHELLGACRLVLEHGEDCGVVSALVDDIPIGYHRLVPTDGGPVTTLIVHPTRCPDPPRSWGVAAQVYALWSERSWGLGDLGDVEALAHRLASAGAGVLQLSPLHSPAPTAHQEASPYYPSTRRALSPMLIPMPSEFARPDGLAPDPRSLIDRDAAWSARRRVLESEFASERWDPAWRTWAAEEHDTLWMVARWNTIADDHGADWTVWPASLRHPDDPTFARRAATDPAVAERLDFHAWCQWRARCALADAASHQVGLVADLAVGFSPHGADAWEFQDLVALDARIGAPPDMFNPHGQEWGLPPFVPWRLRNACYRPIVETLRACLRDVAGIRIDHVMGLMRQYWVPLGGSPRDGAYVHFDAEELLALVALEATRAGAFVVGEDLGTVTPEIRSAMERWGVLGTRVALFEDRPPADYPEMSMATATTHDLPTIRSLWEGGGDQRLAAVIRSLVDAPPDTTARDAVDRLHRLLLDSPARIRLLTTDDLCGAVEQPNRPGTSESSNWSRPLPLPVGEIPLPT